MAVKRDRDPKNDWSDGRSSGIRFIAHRLGLKVSELLKWARRKVKKVK